MAFVLAMIAIVALLADQHRPPEGSTVRWGSACARVEAFGDFVALDDVSLDIPSGSLTALLGPSGGGKSTLLRVIAGLETPDTGTVEIAGADATTLPPQRRNVGFVFQHYAAFKHMTVFKNVAFGLEIRKRPKAEIRQRVNELLELVHLEQFARPAALAALRRTAAAHGAGPRARGASRRCCCSTSRSARSMHRCARSCAYWLRRLHDEVHVTTVFVTHDQEEAMEVADTIVVIAAGRLEQVGTPDELYDHPANDFVMSFLGPVTKLAGALVRPHDLELASAPGPGTNEATVVRVVRLGFEVRVELLVDRRDVWAQTTRDVADRLDLQAGRVVHVKPNGSALPVRSAADLG